MNLDRTKIHRMTNPIDATSQPSSATPDYGETATKLTDKVKMSTRTVLDIAYGEHERQKLDVYLPDVSVATSHLNGNRLV